MILLAAALAQEAPLREEPIEEPTESEVPEGVEELQRPEAFPGEAGMEIIVESDPSVEGARAELDAALREDGYLPGVDLGNRTFYYPRQWWQPRVTIYDEGYVRVKARFISPFPCFPIIGVWSSPRVARQAESRKLEELQPHLSHYRRALITRGMAVRKEELVQELDGLSELPPQQAKSQVISLWLATADTPEGESVRRWIEDWYEDHLPPLTEEELLAVNEARDFPRPWLPDHLGEYWFNEEPAPEFDFLDPEDEEEFFEPEVQGEGLDAEIQTLPAPVKKKGPADRLKGQ